MLDLLIVGVTEARLFYRSRKIYKMVGAWCGSGSGLMSIG